MYLTYDIKSIQRVIFAVPKLKPMIGASGLIADFDRAAQRFVADEQLLFAGGGSGAFHLGSSTEAEQLRERLVEKAHRDGLDLRVGIATSYSQAKQCDLLYPYCPSELAGEPCAMSGLWPVNDETAWRRDSTVHHLIGQRKDAARKDPLGTQFLEDLVDQLPLRLLEHNLQFFKTLVTDPADPTEDAEADAGAAALGNRSRFAIVAMDGNDAGQLQLVAERLVKADDHPWTEEDRSQWLGRMSRALQRSTRRAFLTALARVIAAWAEDLSDQELRACIYHDQDRGGEVLVLPFRPLILGGDDVLLLCHPAHAMTFVQAMHQEFARQTRLASQQAQPESLWLPDHPSLTISAGILFAKATFPLHMAIPYAERLLGNAKAAYRPQEQNSQTPAAVDWDTITDTLIDAPADRRNRELRFHDSERNLEIRLTRRPYLLEPGERGPDIGTLLQLKQRLAGISTSMRSRILPGLRDVWSQRMRFIASVMKKHPILKDELWEEDGHLGKSWLNKTVKTTVGEGGAKIEKKQTVRATGLPDALLLLEEDHRLSQSTTRQVAEVSS